MARLLCILALAVLLAGFAEAGVFAQNGSLNATGNLYVGPTGSALFVNSSSGFAGINTASPQRPLHVVAAQDANIRLQDSSGASPAAYIEFYNDTSRWGYVGLGGHDDKMVLGTTTEKNLSFYTNDSPKMVISAAGYVGIGTTNPGTKLHINGTTVSQGGGFWAIASSATYAAGIHSTRMYTDGTDTYVKDTYLGGGAAGTYGKIRFQTSDVDRLTITNDGKVGIGTTSPNGRLSLGVTGGAPLLVYDNNNNIFAGFGIDTPSGNALALMAHNGGFLSFGKAGNTISTITSGYSEWMRITNTGSVGIGTTTPATALHVASSLSLASSNANFGNIEVGSTNSQAAGYGGAITFGGKYTDAGAYWGWGRIAAEKADSTSGNNMANFNFYLRAQNGATWGTPKMTILNSGNVGIGTTSPAAKLHVNGDFRITGDSFDSLFVNQGGALYISVPSSKKVYFDTTGVSPKVSIDMASGYVGIGTTTPSTTLEVYAGASGDTPDLRVYGGTRAAARLEATVDGGEYSFQQFVTPSGSLEMGIFGDTNVFYLNRNIFSGSVGAAIAISSASYVGLGIMPSYQLHLSTNSAGKPGGGSWTDSSDSRLKANITGINGTIALERLTKLRGVTYEWVNPDEHGNLSGVQAGLVAQDVEMVFPEWVGEINSTGKDALLVGNGTSKTLELPYGFNAYLIEAVKALKAGNDELREENANQQVQIDRQQEQIETLNANNEQLKELVCANRPSAEFCR